MLSGPQIADLLQFLIGLLQSITSRVHVLEIGRFTGATALAMGEMLGALDTLTTIDVEAGLTLRIAQKYWRRAGVEDKIQSFVGDAREVIPTLPGSFQLVFIDGLKTQYPDYWELVLPHVAVGGIVVADDTLWGGNILERSKQARALRKFNRMVRADKHVSSFRIWTIGDGVTVARIHR